MVCPYSLMFVLFCYGVAQPLLNVDSIPKSLVQYLSLAPPFIGPNGLKLASYRFGGDANLIETSIQLTTQHPNKQGWLWATKPLNAQSWIVEAQIQIVGGFAAGEGMGFYLTTYNPSMGPMEETDNIKGFGVVLDTFDNFNDRGAVDAYITQVDGKINFAPHKHDDGSEKVHEGSCDINYRNTPILLMISYIKGTLYLQVTDGTVPFTTCVSAQMDASLDGYYLGVIAKTGKLSDSHEINMLNVYLVDLEAMQTQESGSENSQVKTASSASSSSDPVEDSTKTEVVTTSLQLLNLHVRTLMQNHKQLLETVETLRSSLLDQFSKQAHENGEKAEELSNYFPILAERFNLLMAHLPSSKDNKLLKMESLPTAQDIQNFKLLLREVKDVVESTSSQKNGHIKVQIEHLVMILADMSREIEDILIRQDDLRKGYDYKLRQDSLRAGASSTVVFWVYFGTFEVLFFLALAYWLKHSQDQKKWM